MPHPLSSTFSRKAAPGDLGRPAEGLDALLKSWGALSKGLDAKERRFHGSVAHGIY
jgi:hypothetical protein